MQLYKLIFCIAAIGYGIVMLWTSHFRVGHEPLIILIHLGFLGIIGSVMWIHFFDDEVPRPLSSFVVVVLLCGLVMMESGNSFVFNTSYVWYDIIIVLTFLYAFLHAKKNEHTTKVRGEVL